jgi:hypothetical protein
MATIPSTQKFHTVDTSVDTHDFGSAQLAAGRSIFTMQDILDTVPAGGISLTTTGVSGVATLTGTVLNIPNYGVSTGGTVTSINATIGGSAIAVTGGPVTLSGTLDFSYTGTANDYINGVGDTIVFPDIDFTSLTTVGTSGAATLTSGVLNIPNYASGSGTVTRVGALDGTFISSASADITAAGDLTYDLSATGTPSASVFLRGDNSWATIPGGNVGTVTTVSSTTAGDALDVAVTNPTSTPDVALTFAGASTDYINGEGNLTVFPAIPQGVVESLTTTGTSGAATLAAGVLNVPNYVVAGGTVTSVGASINGNAIGVSGSPVTTSGSLDLAFAGSASQYVDGAGDLTTFPPTIGSAGISGTLALWTGTDAIRDSIVSATASLVTIGGIMDIQGVTLQMPDLSHIVNAGDPTTKYGFASANEYELNIAGVQAIRANAGAVTLYNAGAGKLATTAGGVDIAGLLQVANVSCVGDLQGDTMSVSGMNTPPASATAAGNEGDIRWTAGHVYVCSAPNTWVRAALATF